MTKTWSWKNVDTTFHLFLYFNILINLSLYRLSLTLSSYFSIFLFTSIFTCLLIYLCIYLFMHLSLLISISLYLSILLSLFNQFIYPFHLYLSQSIQFLFGVSLPVHLSSFLLHIFSFCFPCLFFSFFRSLSFFQPPHVMFLSPYLFHLYFVSNCSIPNTSLSAFSAFICLCCQLSLFIPFFPYFGPPITSMF